MYFQCKKTIFFSILPILIAGSAFADSESRFFGGNGDSYASCSIPNVEVPLPSGTIIRISDLNNVNKETTGKHLSSITGVKQNHICTQQEDNHPKCKNKDGV